MDFLVYSRNSDGSARSYAAFGKTKENKDLLKEYKFRYNRNLKHPITGEKLPGWIIGAARYLKIKDELNMSSTLKSPFEDAISELIEILKQDWVGTDEYDIIQRRTEPSWQYIASQS